MTKTALRALTVVALGAAVLLGGTGLAQADTASQPSCAPGEEYQGEFGCVAVQLPEEQIGGARCPDPAMVVLDTAGTCGYPPVLGQPGPAGDPCFRQDPECYDTPSASAAPTRPQAEAPAADAPVGPRPAAGGVYGSTPAAGTQAGLGSGAVGGAWDWHALLGQVWALVLRLLGLAG